MPSGYVTVAKGGASATAAIWVRLTNGVLEALLVIASATKAAGSVVLAVQNVDRSGKISPAGEAHDNAPWGKLTDGSKDLGFEEAQEPGAVDRIAVPVKQIGQDGDYQPSGANAGVPIYTSSIPTGLIGTEVVINATGSGAIAASTASTKRFRLISVTVHLNAGPTTSQDLVVALDALDGPEYDTVLKRVDLSLVPAVDIVYIPDGDLLMEAGDQIVVEYTNTDGVTYGLRIVIEEF